MKTPVEVLIFTECHWYSGFARNAGTYRIASELRDHGYSVQVVDFFGFMTKRDCESIAEKFIDNHTLAVCFSSTFFNGSSDDAFNRNEPELLNFLYERNNKFSEESDEVRAVRSFPFSDPIMSGLIKTFKAKNADLKIIYGGSKAQYQSAQFIDCFIVDFGEEAILKLLHSLKNERDQNVPRLLLYDKDNDHFDFSASKINWARNDFIFPNEILPIEISRGCVYKCKFCNYLLTGKKNLDHVKDMNVLHDELLRNYDAFGTTSYIFCDDTLNDSTEKLSKLAKMIGRLPFELSVAGYIRPELTLQHPEQLALLREIGLRFAKMGIESLHTDTRKLIGKGLPFEKILECLHLQRDHWKNEVITSGSFVFGLPLETRTSLETQAKWLENEALNVLHCVSILPLYLNFSEVPTTKKSDISINYSQYGYQQLEGINWYNPHFDYSFKDLKEIVSVLYKKIQSDPRFRHGGFSGMMIQNSGLTFNDIANVPFSRLDYNLAQKKYAEQIAQYKMKLIGKKKGPANGALSLLKNFLSGLGPFI